MGERTRDMPQAEEIKSDLIETMMYFMSSVNMYKK